MLLSALVLSSAVYAQDPRVLNGVVLVDSAGTVVGHVGHAQGSPSTEVVTVLFDFGGTIWTIPFGMDGPSATYSQLWFTSADCTGPPYVNAQPAATLTPQAVVANPTWDVYRADLTAPRGVLAYNSTLWGSSCMVESRTAAYVQQAVFEGSLASYFTAPFSVRRAP